VFFFKWRGNIRNKEAGSDMRSREVHNSELPDFCSATHTMTGPDRGTEYPNKGVSTAEPEVKVVPRRGNLHFWVKLNSNMIGFAVVQGVRLASGLGSEWL